MPFLVFEGIDGSGKTTLIQELLKRIQDNPYKCHVFRAPGSTNLGERLRALVLDPTIDVCSESQVFLFLASFSQLITEIKEILRKNELVILDRFFYSTIAYQVYGLKLTKKLIPAIEQSSLNVTPDLVFHLDLSLEEANRRRESHAKDRFESKELAFFERVTEGYKEMQSIYDFTVVDANKPLEEVTESVLEILEKLGVYNDRSNR